MPDTKIDQNPYHDLPTELVDKFIGFLPLYRFVGANSVHNVCQSWKDLITENPELSMKPSKGQIVRSVMTEQEVLLVLTNEAIFDEIRFDKLMRLSLKVAKAREFVLPLLDFNDLLEAGKDDIDIARSILASDEASSLIPGQLTTLIGYHEALANEYLDTNPTLFLVTAFNLSIHINIAKRILAMPGFSPAVRYSICLNHDELIEKNLPLVEEVLKNLNDSEELYIFARSHSYRRNVAEFIMERFSDKYANDPSLCAIMAIHHLDIALELFQNKTLCQNIDSAEYLINILNAHFEICEMVMKDPELIANFAYEDIVFTTFLMHFPRSEVFFDNAKFQLDPSFLKTYGAVLELPRVKKVRLEAQGETESSTNCGILLALVYDYLENIIEFEKFIEQPQPNLFLISIFTEMNLSDLKPMAPLILNILADSSLRKFVPCDIIHIWARRLQSVREYIVTDEKLIRQILQGKFFNYLDVDLEEFLYACPTIERKIMRTDSLRVLLNEKQSEVSSNRQYIYEHLKELLVDATLAINQPISKQRVKHF